MTLQPFRVNLAFTITAKDQTEARDFAENAAQHLMDTFMSEYDAICAPSINFEVAPGSELLRDAKR